MFSGATRSACGTAQSAMGPFYCPNDREVYLDTSFFRELETRFRGCTGKACEFSQAYVIAHEVGHHVQNLLGILPKVQQAQRASGDRVQSNHLQVQVELQADCFAGVWANHAEAQKQVPRSGRHRRGVADRVRDRRRHAAAANRRARWCRTASPMARPSSASAGSRPASRKAPSRPATHSRRPGYNRTTMPGIDDKRPFVPLKIAVLTVSDTRELADDKSGAHAGRTDREGGPCRGGARHRHRRRRENPRADAHLDRRQRRSTSSSRPAAPASPAAT